MAEIDKDDFKAVMGSFGSGVTVVTTVDPEGNKWGITVSAFSSLSMEPRLCMVCIDKNAGSRGPLEAAGKFAVNILSADQEALSNNFASRKDDKFAGLTFKEGGETACPVFEDSLGWMECTVKDIFDAGDHDIFVGELQSCGYDAEKKPLLYWRGAYGDITSRPKSW